MARAVQELIADLARAFPRTFANQRPGDALETVRVYARALDDVDPDLLEQAVEDVKRTSEFFPTIRAIREAAAERALELPGEASALAQVEARIAWARSGSHGDPPRLDPLVREALDHVGGFHAFRAGDDPTVVRGQFGRLFRELRASALRDAQTGRTALPAAPVRGALEAAPRASLVPRYPATTRG